MRRAHPLGLVLLASLQAGSCATVSRTPAATPVRRLRSATLAEVLSAYQGYCGGIDTLSASGDLDVEDLAKGKTRKLSVRLVATRGARLYLKGSVAIVTALEIVSDGDRFWFQVPSKKTVWTGPVAFAPREEGSEPYYALRPADLTEALLPEPLASSSEDVLLLESDPTTFSLSLARPEAGRGTVKRRIWLARESLELLRSHTYDAGGDLLVQTSYGSWKGGMPRLVEVFRPREGYRATFSLSRSEKNVAVPERAFVPRNPEGYQLKEVPVRP